jgi:hypothetical protein
MLFTSLVVDGSRRPTGEVIAAGRTIRLECSDCGRGDFDFITAAQLAAAIKDGWQDVWEAHSFEETITDVIEDPDATMDWATHFGRCPDCIREEAEPDELGRLIRALP